MTYSYINICKYARKIWIQETLRELEVQQISIREKNPNKSELHRGVSK